MSIVFPIILEEVGIWISVISSHHELNRKIEAVDVENGEYEVWDKEGRRLNLYMDGKTIKVRIQIPEETHPDLRTMLLRFLELDGARGYDRGRRMELREKLERLEFTDMLRIAQGLDRYPPVSKVTLPEYLRRIWNFLTLRQD